MAMGTVVRGADGWKKQALQQTPAVLVHGSNVHMSQKVKTTQMSTTSRMSERRLAYPYNGILLSHEKE